MAGKSEIKTRFDRRGRECPLCGSHSKGCSATVDGLHLCRGEPADGWVSVTPGRDAEGFGHYRAADDARAGLEGKARQYAKALTPQGRAALADALGLPVEALAAVPLIGWADDGPRGAWSFPERDGAGKVVGIGLRKPDGGKLCVRGSNRGLTVPAAWSSPGGPVFVVEGPSDTLALRHCGLSVVGRPSNTGGVDFLAALFADLPPARPVYLVGENDAKGGGKWPGRDGALSSARRLAERLGREVRVCFPPNGMKDGRAWVLDAAAGHGDAVDWAGIGAEALAFAEATHEVIRPAAALTDDAPAKSKPRGLRTTRLDAIDPQPVRWLVPGYVPLGKLVLFAGDGGHGKTTLTLHMAACLSAGRPCFGLDYDPPPPAEVLIASCEDDFADTVVPRLVTVGGDRSKVRRVDGVETGGETPGTFSLAHFERLAEDLEDNPAVKLVIIDPAGAYIGGAGVDDHKDSELRSLLGPLADLAAKRKVTVLLVKHLNKGATAKAVHRVGGSAGYVNAVRAAFVVAPDPNHRHRKLFLPLKFNIAKKPAGIAYNLLPVPPEERGEILDQFPALDGDDRDQLGGQLFRPVWDGVVETDADSALSEHGGADKPTRVAECREWLSGFLAEWAWPDAEILLAAEDAGFTEDNVRKAKTLLRNNGELHARPDGPGGAWWNWTGTKRDRRPDRPRAYEPQSQETQETQESRVRPAGGSSVWDRVPV